MLSSLLDLLFPQICFACGEASTAKLKHICVTCRQAMPRTNWHLTTDNPIDKLFWGRTNLQQTTAFLKFEKGGKVQELIHQLKYKGVKEIGEILGEMAAFEIGQSNFFDKIDIVVPVPIHPLKQKKRGFNQSHKIADGISNITELPVDKTALIKSYNTSSQTKKSRFKRWINVEATFQITQPIVFEDKHILLVDDVITTGSTVEACTNELLKIRGAKISLLTIAATI